MGNPRKKGHPAKQWQVVLDTSDALSHVTEDPEGGVEESDLLALKEMGEGIESSSDSSKAGTFIRSGYVC